MLHGRGLVHDPSTLSPGAMFSRPIGRYILQPNHAGPRKHVRGLHASNDEVSDGIHPQLCSVHPGVEPSIRPRPIRSMSNEAAANWVVVKVVDHRPQRARFVEIAVVAAAALPEAIVNLAVG